MPSTLIGAQSGGVQLVSGNPFSGRSVQPTGLFLRCASGTIYFGYSGGVTITSGGGLASGGLLDGIPLDNQQERSIYLGGGGVEQVWATTPAASSGVARVFWQPYPNP